MFMRIISAVLAFFMSVFSLFFGARDKNVLMNVAYGNEPSQRFDLYLPDSPSDEPMGLMLFIHGGSWTGGDKKEFTSMCKEIHSAKIPLAAATVNYRLMAETNSIDCNTMLADIKASVSSICSLAREKGFQFNRMGLMGNSAGGHLALMYAYKCASESPLEVEFVISLVGPTDLNDPGFLTEIESSYKYDLISHLAGTTVNADNIEQKRDAVAAVSPVTYVTSSSVPSILAYGGKDTLVPLSNGERLDAKLTECSVEHMFFPFPDSGHGLDNNSDISQQLYEAYVNYLDKYLF